MKSMKISSTEITITYKTVEKLEKVYSRMYDYEKKRCSIEGTVLTYDLSNVKFGNIILVVRDLFVKSVEDCRFERNHIDLGKSVRLYLDAFISEGKLFRVTLLNRHGSKGGFGFGIWQYGRILSLNDTEDSFQIRLRNSNIEDFVHEIDFVDDIGVLIEIGDIQF